MAFDAVCPRENRAIRYLSPKPGTGGLFLGPLAGPCRNTRIAGDGVGRLNEPAVRLASLRRPGERCCLAIRSGEPPTLTGVKRRANRHQPADCEVVAPQIFCM
jgi:hypothetical protein